MIYFYTIKRLGRYAIIVLCFEVVSTILLTGPKLVLEESREQFILCKGGYLQNVHKIQAQGLICGPFGGISVLPYVSKVNHVFSH